MQLLHTTSIFLVLFDIVKKKLLLFASHFAYQFFSILLFISEAAIEKNAMIYLYMFVKHIFFSIHLKTAAILVIYWIAFQ